MRCERKNKIRAELEAHFPALRLSIHPSIPSPSIYLPICLSMFPSIHIYLFITINYYYYYYYYYYYWKPTFLIFIHTFIHPSILPYPSVYPSTYLSIHSSIHPYLPIHYHLLLLLLLLLLILYTLYYYLFVFSATAPPQWARVSSFTMFLDHTQRRTTVGRTPLDE